MTSYPGTRTYLKWKNKYPKPVELFQDLDITFPLIP